MVEFSIPRDLGGNLALRRATRSDVDELVDFHGRILSSWEGETEFRVGAWTRDLMTKPHPTFQVGDFTVVEDTTTRKIVSSMNLISQVWTYGGIPFKVGRPELVGTHPDYRNRGLIRKQFEVIHHWSTERGELVQAITGIPYYYRQFGYEMAMNLHGGRDGYLQHIPILDDGKPEPYVVRPVEEKDLPFIAKVYEQACQRSLVSCARDDTLWRYELCGKDKDNFNCLELRLIETPEGEAVGYLAHPSFRWGATQVVFQYEVKAGISWSAVTPSVLRYLKSAGEALPPYQGQEAWGSFAFILGVSHPVYEVLPNSLPRVRRPYAWYLRVPDLPAFVRLITPVLEKRLATSPLANHSGEIKLTFYRDGLRLVFEQGRIKEVESWTPFPQGNSGQAGFPGLTFLQLLFGYRSLDELKCAFADCWTESDEDQALLSTLFPKQASDVWPIS